MLLLGIDLGTSAIKVAVIDAATGVCVAAAQYPATEMPITALHTGWAEQAPEQWWEHTQTAILKLCASGAFDPAAIAAIGIAYQMHGLVLLDKDRKVLRDAIIWCDSRAVEIGAQAFEQIGPEKCLTQLLNSPGNFTAAKLAWVKAHEPAIYAQVDKVLLPGDYLALQLTGEVCTTIAAMSEGVFWDFARHSLSADLLEYYGFDRSLIPEVKPVFGEHGLLQSTLAAQLGLSAGIPICYKAGDQPNNALSLNVLQPGEVAATAGTSGVIYAVSDQLRYDPVSRVNSFAHVNHSRELHRIGVLLCINGCGSMNRYVKDNFAQGIGYEAMNAAAAGIDPGSDGLMVFPFGNGAERMLHNRLIGASLHGMDFNRHTPAHLFSATQEGIAFAFRYGLEIMQGTGIQPHILRAGKANLLLSSLFTKVLVDVTGVPLELRQSDGSIGAAIGAGIGLGYYSDAAEALGNAKVLRTIEPDCDHPYEALYQQWKTRLGKALEEQ